MAQEVPLTVSNSFLLRPVGNFGQVASWHMVYNPATNYQIADIVEAVLGSPNVFMSIVANNLGNPLVDGPNWKKIGGT